jgi:hypothetical protein
MDLQLTNKLVFIIAGAQGIGSVIVDRDAPVAEHLQADLRRSGGVM